jgi:aryl-alcohol dehydrogenase-like predicted oxidoreductase
MASNGAWMTDRIRLGRSDLEVPRLGVGAMTWGSPTGRSRWGPAKLAYGGTPGPEEEARAFEASLSAGVDLFDTAAMYSGGASERRLGELADGRHVVIATKFPPGWLSTAEALPDALDQSLARLRRSTIDLYQHHFPSRRIPIASLMGFMADAVEAGKVRAVGVSNYSAAQRSAAPRRARGAGRAGDPPCLQPGRVLPVASAAGGEWAAGCLPGAGDRADRIPAAGDGRAHREVSAGRPAQGDPTLRPLLPRRWPKEVRPFQ